MMTVLRYQLLLVVYIVASATALLNLHAAVERKNRICFSTNTGKKGGIAQRFSWHSDRS